MLTAAPSLRPCQRDQVQRVGWRYPSLSVTRLPGDEDAIGQRGASVQQDEHRDGNDVRQQQSHPTAAPSRIWVCLQGAGIFPPAPVQGFCRWLA